MKNVRPVLASLSVNGLDHTLMEIVDKWYSLVLFCVSKFYYLIILHVNPIAIITLVRVCFCIIMI